ncbi:MAG: nucleotidyltransferase domain-containing protein [Dehalococcoidia bacterium]|nr:nucleotidyltransferase domain-containing protein [Dehalococcoidia bacterium]
MKSARIAQRKPKNIKEIEPLFFGVKACLRKIYGKRLAAVILYGSFANGKANEDSDIDIAVVLKGSVDKAEEISKIHDAIYPLSLEYGQLISIYPLSEEALGDVEWPLHYYIKNEGIKV